MTSSAARFAATFAALLASHHVGDYWVQTDHQAITKGLCGSPEDNVAGRRACLAHVASYTATTMLTVVGVNRALRLGLGWRAILAGQAVSAVSHFWADRRYTVRRLAQILGKGEFYDDRNGAALLDQSFHVAWLMVAALATATKRGSA